MASVLLDRIRRIRLNEVVGGVAHLDHEVTAGEQDEAAEVRTLALHLQQAPRLQALSGGHPGHPGGTHHQQKTHKVKWSHNGLFIRTLKLHNQLFFHLGVFVCLCFKVLTTYQVKAQSHDSAFTM